MPYINNYKYIHIHIYIYIHYIYIYIYIYTHYIYTYMCVSMISHNISTIYSIHVPFLYGSQTWCFQVHAWEVRAPILHGLQRADQLCACSSPTKDGASVEARFDFYVQHEAEHNGSLKMVSSWTVAALIMKSFLALIMKNGYFSPWTTVET